MMKKILSQWAGWTIVTVIFADWLTKFVIQNQLMLHQKVSLINGWIYFVRLHNEGIAFSWFSNGGPVRTAIIAVFALIAVGLLLQALGSVTERHLQFGIALVIGGAIGNLGDRLLNGGVTDFIAVQHFPYVFNVADIAVCVGGVLLALSLLRKEPRPAA